MTNFSIGLSALRSSQFALDVVSGNLANANTPGYHRQNVHLESLRPNTFGHQQLGRGVTINYIERVRNSVTESSLTNSIADASNVDQLLVIERQIEILFQPGEGSLNERLDTFFGEITKLTSTPGDATQRNVVIEQADQVADLFHQIASQLFELKSAIRYQIEQEVTELNIQMESLSELTAQIEIMAATNIPNRELDERDNLINQIAQVIDVSRHEHLYGGINVAFGGTSIQQGTTPIQFQTIALDGGKVGISIDQANTAITFDSGRLQALLDSYNSTIPKLEARLDELAAGLIQQFDQVHATGVGIDGSFSFLKANRTVMDATVPLNESGAAFPITNGELFISIIDPSGNRRTESISIDPVIHSLEDFAAAIDGLDNLQASVNPQNNQLQIFAAPGYKFDFTGSLETIPVLDGFSGTSEPTFSGVYTGNTNQSLSYVIDGTGDVGVSGDLFANVFDESGTLITKLNIGKGYEAGTEIKVAEGVTISFSAGTVAAGDSFASQLVSQPDGSGILSSLGLNSFFKGQDARTIGIDDQVLADPRKLASGKSGDIADTANLFEMVELQHSRGMSSNRLSFAEYLNEISTEIGSSVRANSQLSLSLNGLKYRYEQERDSVSGVDLNEELVYLQQFQKSYEAAVRVIQTAEDMLNELFSVVR